MALRKKDGTVASSKVPNDFSLSPKFERLHESRNHAATKRYVSNVWQSACFVAPRLTRVGSPATAAQLSDNSYRTNGQMTGKSKMSEGNVSSDVKKWKKCSKTTKQT